MLIYTLKKRIKKYIDEKLAPSCNLNSLIIEEPKNKKFGDLSTNAAMILAPALKKNPLDIAKKLIDEELRHWQEIENAEIVRPGFINFNFKTIFLK